MTSKLIDTPYGPKRMETIIAGFDALNAHAALTARVAELEKALHTLVDSLQWEENRNGTTYHGYEQARAALARKVTP